MINFLSFDIFFIIYVKSGVIKIDREKRFFIYEDIVNVAVFFGLPLGKMRGKWLKKRMRRLKRKRRLMRSK